MNGYSIVAFISSFSNLAAGITVSIFAKGSKKEVRGVFFLFAFSLFIWSFGLASLYLAPNQESANFWVKVIYTGLILFPIFYLHFSLVIATHNEKFKKMLLMPAYILGIVVGLLLFGVDIRGFLVDVEYTKHNKFFPVGGELYYLFFLILMLAGTGFLIKGYLGYNPLQKSRIKYCILGVFVALPGGIADLLPRFGFELFHHIAHISSAFGIWIGVYAIIKQRFEERPMRVSFLYTLVVSICAVGLFWFLNKSEYFLKVLPQFESLFPTFLTALIIIFLFPLDVLHIIICTCFLLPFLFLRTYTVPIICGIGIITFHHILRKEIAERFISRIPFKLKHLQEKIEREFTERSVFAFNEIALAERIIDVLKGLRFVDTFIMILDEKEEGYVSPQRKEVIRVNEPIINWLKSQKRELVKEEIEEDVSIEQRENLRGVFERIGADIFLPMLHGEELIGIVCLKEKRGAFWIYKLFQNVHHELSILSGLSKERLPVLFKNAKIAGLRKETKELATLQKITFLIQQRDDLEEIFCIALTPVIHKEIMGFNTAILLWKDEEGILKGEMGIGKEVYEIWKKEIVKQEPKFNECLDIITIMKDEICGTKLNRKIKETKISANEIEGWSIFKQTKGGLFNTTHTQAREEVRELLQIDIKTFGIIPLKTKDEIKGFLIVEGKYGRDEITSSDISILEAFVDQVIICIEERRSLKQLKEAANMLKTLDRITREWTSIYKLDTLLNSAVKTISEELKGYCSFYLFDKKKTFFKTNGTPGCSILGLGETMEPIEKKRESHLLSCPIMWRDNRFTGGIILQRDVEKESFTKTEKEFFEILIDYINISGINISFFEEESQFGDKSREELLRERLSGWKDAVSKIRHKIGNKLYTIESEFSQIEKKISKDTDIVKIFSKEKMGMEEAIGDTKRILDDLKKYVNFSEMNVQSVDINSLLERSITTKDDWIDLEFKLDESIPSIEADSGKLRDVFTELTENAEHFMAIKRFIIRKRKEGIENKELMKEIRDEFDIAAELDKWLTEVSLEDAEKEKIIVDTKFIPADNSNVYGLKSEDYIKIEFIDTGPGVHHEIKPKIFEPLFTMRKRGTGLGLSIIEQNIALHRGLIEEKGVFGKGARFVIFLPTKQIKGG